MTQKTTAEIKLIINTENPNFKKLEDLIERIGLLCESDGWILVKHSKFFTTNFTDEEDFLTEKDFT